MPKKNNFLPIATKDRKVLKYMALMGQIGAVMVSSIIIFKIFFFFLGKKFFIFIYPKPLIFLLGLFAGFYSVYKLLKKFFIENNENDSD